MKRLVVLGGSTPFTAAFVDAICDWAEPLSRHELVLHGRSSRNLAIVARYARARLHSLGWQVESSTDLSAALVGASIVIHQVRYGGMAARARAEEISVHFGITPDETLGPGALYSALELLPELDRMIAVLHRTCPDAWILNLTNPLSLVTARMIRRGVKRCVGLCELPRVTFNLAASVLGKDARDGQWSYVGLNHRGFIVRLSWGDRKDYISDLVRRLGSKTLNGITGAQIATLGAIPTKYFSMFADGGSYHSKGRAEFLSRLRLQLLDELRRDPYHSPPGLRERYMAWYESSVVPMIAALSTSTPRLQEVNLVTERSIVEEGRAWVSHGGVDQFEAVEPGYAVRDWMERLRTHEYRMLRAIDEPSIDSIACALAADPNMASEQVGHCARFIWERLGLAEPTPSRQIGDSSVC